MNARGSLRASLIKTTSSRTGWIIVRSTSRAKKIIEWIVVFVIGSLGAGIVLTFPIPAEFLWVRLLFGGLFAASDIAALVELWELLR